MPVGKSGSKKRFEPFLLEMAVVGENVRQSLVIHRHHRNTVGQAIALVGAAAVEMKTRHEGIMALVNHCDFGIVDERCHHGSRMFSHAAPRLRKIGQVFVQYLLGCDQPSVTQGPAQAEGLPVKEIGGVRQYDPVERISEDQLH